MSLLDQIDQFTPIDWALSLVVFTAAVFLAIIVFRTLSRRSHRRSGRKTLKQLEADSNYQQLVAAAKASYDRFVIDLTEVGGRHPRLVITEESEPHDDGLAEEGVWRATFVALQSDPDSPVCWVKFFLDRHPTLRMETDDWIVTFFLRDLLDKHYPLPPKGR